MYYLKLIIKIHTIVFCCSRRVFIRTRSLALVRGTKRCGCCRTLDCLGLVGNCSPSKSFNRSMTSSRSMSLSLCYWNKQIK